jgi:hypothetical protein
MATSRNEILEFALAMGRHSTVSLHDCKRLLHYGATVKRLAELACNRELTPSEIRKDEKIQMDILAICAPHDCEVKFGGDPRGCTVKIAVPDGYTNDWGKEGICVPTA